MYTHMHVYRRYLRKILLHVPQTPIINRASRSHARKVKGEGGSGGRGYRDHPGYHRIGGRRIRKKWFQKWILILHDSGAILGV